MAATFSLFFHIDAHVSGKHYSIGNKHTPYTFATVNDLMFTSKEPVASGENCILLVPPDVTSSVAFIIPSVDGYFYWNTNLAAPQSDMSSSFDWKAGVPFILPTGKEPQYSATVTGRAAATAAYTATLWFGNTSDDDGYVEVFMVE